MTVFIQNGVYLVSDEHGFGDYFDPNTQDREVAPVNFDYLSF